MDDLTIRTATSPVRIEIEKIKGSRFIADLSPVDSHAKAMAFLEATRGREPSATHHVWAYRLATGQTRSSDDGEPVGTAGSPILHRLEEAGVADVIVVITRYYGGTNLGRGGLRRAYGRATGTVLAIADMVTTPVTTPMRLVFAYDLTAMAESAISAHGATVTAASYAGEVTMDLEVPVAKVDKLSEDLIEASAGRISISST